MAPRTISFVRASRQVRYRPPIADCPAIGQPLKMAVNNSYALFACSAVTRATHLLFMFSCLIFSK